ncbi:unnamed protein product, partial [Adineta ricciae]
KAYLFLCVDVGTRDNNQSETMKSQTTGSTGQHAKVQEQSDSEDELVEETPQTSGLYLFLDKTKEVKECVNNVLSYGREHGVLMTGVQLKTLLDVQNVEITKDRACALVELISNNVVVVNNPHFVAPTAQNS